MTVPKRRCADWKDSFFSLIFHPQHKIVFFFSCHMWGMEILVPRPGVEPMPPAWKHAGLITGPPGISHKIVILFFFFLVAPHGMWDLSSPTREQTPALKGEILTFGLPGKSPDSLKYIVDCFKEAYSNFKGKNHRKEYRLNRILSSNKNRKLNIRCPELDHSTKW